MAAKKSGAKKTSAKKSTAKKSSAKKQAKSRNGENDARGAAKEGEHLSNTGTTTIGPATPVEDEQEEPMRYDEDGGGTPAEDEL